MKKSLTLTISLCLLVSGNSFADKITIGVENINNLPHYDGESAQYNGYAKELFDKFAQDNQHEVTYRALPIKRLYSELFSGAIDFKFPDNPYWNGDGKKDVKVIYSQQPAEKTVDVTFVQTPNMGKSTITKLGTISGFSPWVYMDSIKAGKITTNEVKSFDQAANMLNLGRVDGVYYNLEAGNLLLKKLDLANKIGYDASLSKSDADFYVSTVTNEKLLNQFNEFMEKNAQWVKELRIKHGIAN